MSVELRVPSATIAFDSSYADLETFQFQAAVMNHPTALVEYHTGSEETATTVRVIASSEIIDAVAQDQKTMFDDASDTSITIDSYDGRDSSLVFSGFSTQPSYTLGVGQVSLSSSVVHKAARIQQLITGIYDYPAEKHRAYEVYTEDSPTGIIKQVLQDMVANFDPCEDAQAAAIRERIHADNARPLEIFYKILDASETSIEGLADLAKEPAVGKYVRGVVVETLANNMTDGLHLIHAFCGLFQMVYVPGIGEEDYGKFIMKKDILLDPEPKSAEVRSFTIAAGPKSVSPLAQVVVRGVPSSDHKDYSQDGCGELHSSPRLAAYPAEALGSGQRMFVGPPPYIPKFIVSSTNYVPASDNETLSLAEYKNGLKTRARVMEQLRDDTLRGIVEDWAKNIFVDQTLALATASLSCTLDYSWEIGRYYLVSAQGADGEVELFRGFLAGLTHNVSSKTHSPIASTTLNFTHVQVGNFSLPVS